MVGPALIIGWNKKFCFEKYHHTVANSREVMRHELPENLIKKIPRRLKKIPKERKPGIQYGHTGKFWTLNARCGVILSFKICVFVDLEPPSGNVATKPVCSGHECFKLFSRTRLNDSVGFAFLVRQIPITSHLTNPYELVSVEGKFQSNPGIHIFAMSPVVEISKSHQRTSFL